MRENFLTLILFWNFAIERWWVSDVRNVNGVTDFVLERTLPEEHLNLSKSGFISEEGYSGCKCQNIAIRALKGKLMFFVKYGSSGPIKWIQSTGEVR